MAELKEDMLVPKVKVKEVSKEYEVPKEDLVPKTGDDAPTWYNKTAGILDKFRLIPRMIMLAYIYAFYKSITWFMTLAEPSNAQARLGGFVAWNGHRKRNSKIPGVK